MKLMHVSDLHLGKRLNGFSLLEDQSHILNQMVQMACTHAPDAVLIAGDVYDKAVPSVEAVQLFDDFLCALCAQNIKVCIISGNHDSPERTAFGARLMTHSGVYVAPVYDGKACTVPLEDAFGSVHVHLLPFVKPAHVRRFFEEEPIESYTDALRVAIAAMPVDTAQRNVLVTHQFFIGAVQCESEEIVVGGTDAVDSAVLAPFDYVALGHLHAPQSVGRERVRYCGTPLKYSFSEAMHQKSVTMVHLAQKGAVQVETLPLVPLHDLRALRDTFDTITSSAFYLQQAREDYLQITLLDEQEVPDAMTKLRVIYPNIMQVLYDNQRTRAQVSVGGMASVETKSPLELFDELYEKQNGQAMSAHQRSFCTALMQSIWEEQL